MHTLGEKIWGSEYLGDNGAITVAKKAYLDSNKAYAETLTCIMTLYSAIGTFIAQLKHLRLQFVFPLFFTVWCFRSTMKEFMMKDYIGKLTNETEKEAMMAYLYMASLLSPVHYKEYRERARIIGFLVVESLSFEEYRVISKLIYHPQEKIKKEDLLTFSGFMSESKLLVCARLTKLEKSWGERDNYRTLVSRAIRSPSLQEKFGWNTINRAARLIGDKEMKIYSASMSTSRDVKIKSGL